MTSRIRFTRAAQVFEMYPTLKDSVPEPKKDVEPGTYAQQLAAGEDPLLALAFFAHCLPKREVVWWGAKCVGGLVGDLSDDDKALLDATETWVREADEDTRAAVHAAAEAGDKGSAATWMAYGAGWSGGSLSPNADQNVPMPNELTPKAVNAGLGIALGGVHPKQREEAINACLQAGLSFAEGDTMPLVTLPPLPAGAVLA